MVRALATSHARIDFSADHHALYGAWRTFACAARTERSRWRSTCRLHVGLRIADNRRIKRTTTGSTERAARFDRRTHHSIGRGEAGTKGFPYTQLECLAWASRTALRIVDLAKPAGHNALSTSSARTGPQANRGRQFRLHSGYLSCSFQSPEAGGAPGGAEVPAVRGGGGPANLSSPRPRRARRGSRRRSHRNPGSRRSLAQWL